MHDHDQPSAQGPTTMKSRKISQPHAEQTATHINNPANEQAHA
jgi:hypothetical protein